MYSKIYKNILFPFFDTCLKSRNTSKYIKWLRNTQWWTTEKLRDFQWGELHKLLDHASVQVPYWKDAFDKLGLRLADIKTYDDFRTLPVIDKDLIKAQHYDLVAVNYRGKTYRKSTGGSTGEPLHFEYTPESYDWRVACSKRGYGWAGYEDGKKSAYIWGVAIGKVPVLKRIKESLHHAFLRQRYYNCFGFTEQKMKEVISDMNKYKPECIVAYTNPLYDFVKYAERSRAIKFKPKAIILAAEKLHEFQREKIRAVFGCPVFNTYGSREFMLIASECEMHNGLHVNIENLFVEIIKENGDPAKPGEMGDIVITDLHNYGMPFIRYKIGDIAIASDRKCLCGRGLPLIDKIEGRVLDTIRTPDGRIVPGEFFPHLMKEFNEVRRFQVVQKNLHSLNIKIVKEKDLPKGRLAFMRNEINKVLGREISVKIDFVKDIPLTRTGKLRVTISKLNDAVNN
jgi:phenylacetate-CoA ligase